MGVDPFFGLFTSNQKDKLLSSGFLSLYEVLTYLPYRVQQIKPMGTSMGLSREENYEVSFLWQARLEQIQVRKSRRSYFLLTFSGSIGVLNTYFFGSARFWHSKLKIGQTYQLILSKNKNFWTLKRLAILSEKPISEEFVLGRAKIQTYWQPNYLKKKSVDTLLFRKIHQKIPKEAYKLDLHKLVPKTKYIPQIIDLWGIHHPDNFSKFIDSSKDYGRLQVFLQLSLLKYINTQNQNKKAVISNFDLEFLKNSVSYLDYTLSKSQKQTIWEILSELD